MPENNKSDDDLPFVAPILGKYQIVFTCCEIRPRKSAIIDFYVGTLCDDQEEAIESFLRWFNAASNTRTKIMGEGDYLTPFLTTMEERTLEKVANELNAFRKSLDGTRIRAKLGMYDH